MKTIEISAGRFAAGIVGFAVAWILYDQMFVDTRATLMPVVMVIAFLTTAWKSPPLAIMILLYYSMTKGGWFILGAAPITMLLARRYQRLRLQLELNPVHIRRTVLLAVAAMAATMPFIGASISVWSRGNQGQPRSIASPFLPGNAPGEAGGLLQELAGQLGFGPSTSDSNQAGGSQSGGGQGSGSQGSGSQGSGSQGSGSQGSGSQGSGGQSGSQNPSPEESPLGPLNTPNLDDSFNWWLVAAAVAILALVILAVWLWLRGRNSPAPIFAPAMAAPLKRLEAIGARIGRPRIPHEGVITYAWALTARTGDERLSVVGPLVSGQVYQSASVSPREVGDSLSVLEAAPPPIPPAPTPGQRFATWQAELPSNRAIGYALLVMIAIVAAIALVVPRLSELQSGQFEIESGLEQLQVVPLGTEHIDNF